MTNAAMAPMRSSRSTGREINSRSHGQSEPAAPSGVVTFLFTDIEGSTRRWEADPDAMRVALEAHNQVLRETVAAHDGTVFNYTGDGMCAVFASPRAAVDAAIDAQRTLGVAGADGNRDRRGRTPRR